MYTINLNKEERNFTIKHVVSALQLNKLTPKIKLQTTGPRGPIGLTGPQGEQGETGEQGPQGDPGEDGVIQSIVAGDNIEVNNDDPANPVVSATGSSQGGGNYFVWDPTETEPEGNLFADFQDMMDLVALIPGKKFIQYIGSPTIPDGTYNWDGITWLSNGIPSNFGGGAMTAGEVVVTSWLDGGLDDGAGLIHTGSSSMVVKDSGVDLFRMGLGAGMASAVASVFDIQPGSFGFIIDVADGASIANIGYEPITANGTANIIILVGGSNVNLTNDIIRGDLSGGQGILLISNPAAAIDPNRTDANYDPGSAIFPVINSSATLINFDGSGVGMSAQTVAAGIIEAYLNGGGGGDVNWGDIGGNIADQSDLQTAFDNLTAYVDASVVGLLDDRGNYDASGNNYPSSGGSGSGGAINKGDIWVVSVPGVLNGVDVLAGDQIRALVDNPSNPGDWAISEANIGYVPENVVNKDTDSTMAADSDVKYPSQKAVKTALALKKDNSVSATNRLLGRSSAGSGVIQEITLGTGFSFVGGALTYVNSQANMYLVGTYSFASDTIVFYNGSPTTDIDLITPSLGMVLRVRTAGSKDFGLGVITLAVNDLLYYDGTNWRPIYNGLPTLTANRVLITDAGGVITAASTSTYPTPTEFQFVKGVTSAIQPQLDAKVPSSYLDTDGTLAANSDTKVATQKAVKTYVDTAVTGLLDFKGSTDASANPNYPAASKGDAYVVSVAGKIGGASGKSVDVGDVYLAKADNAGGTEASVGTSWTVLEHNLVGALLSANNLSDVGNAATAFGNIKQDATTSATGVVELATTAETDTGTDTTRAVTPDGLAGSVYGTKASSIQVIEAATALTTGDGKAYIRIPSALNGMDLVSCAISVFAKSTSGTPTVQLARGRQANATTAHAFTDMLSTKLTIDANEFDSKDAAAAAVIDTSNDDVLTGDLIRIDVDVAGTGTTGLFVTMAFRTP